MHYYEIYAGGVRTGELVIQTMQAPNADGLVLLSETEYNNAFSAHCPGRERRGDSNYHEGYDVVTAPGERVVLYPAHMGFDHPAVRRLWDVGA